MATAQVSVQRCESYDMGAVASAVREGVEDVEGLDGRLKPGTSVLLKPNIISPQPPDSAVCTHPAVVRAVAEICCDADCEVLIADQPGYATMGDGRVIFERSGIAQACDGLDVEFDLLKHSGYQWRDVPDPLQIDRTRVAEAAVDADVVINLPKCKTHQQTLLTGAVKNMFGVIAPRQRIETHLLGSFNAFGEGLADTFSACVPDLNIMDAIVGMEGKGPSHGQPCRIGAIVVSEDAVAVDAVIESMTGFAPGRIRTTTAAAEKSVGECALSDIRVTGADPSQLAVNMQWPPGGIRRGFPHWLGNLLGGLIWVRPQFDHEQCVGCGACAAVCPVDAITGSDDNYPDVDRGKCIECFCCQEVCPEGAIDSESSWLAERVVGDRDYRGKGE